MAQLLCGIDDIRENAARGFTVTLGGEPADIFVVKRAGQVYAYRNVCPHRGTSLDWMPDQFMDPDQRYIQCATHDARFEVESGLCVMGPCLGDHLRALPVSVRDGQVFLLAESGHMNNS